MQENRQEGPCIDAVASESQVAVDDIAATEPHERWPGYVAAASTADIRAVAGIPMLAEGSLAALDDIVLLTVRDESLAVPVRRPTRAMDAGGRGLEIVDLISLQWGLVKDPAGSKAVWASFALRDQPDCRSACRHDQTDRAR